MRPCSQCGKLGNDCTCGREATPPAPPAPVGLSEQETFGHLHSLRVWLDIQRDTMQKGIARDVLDTQIDALNQVIEVLSPRGGGALRQSPAPAKPSREDAERAKHLYMGAAMRRVEAGGYSPEAHAAVTEADTLLGLTGQSPAPAERRPERMCVNCGRMARVERGESLPECVGPDGLSACTFDMTPDEAANYWRQKWRDDFAARRPEREALDVLRRLVEWHDARYVQNLGEPFAAIVSDARAALRESPDARREPMVSMRAVSDLIRLRTRSDGGIAVSANDLRNQIAGLAQAPAPDAGEVK